MSNNDDLLNQLRTFVPKAKLIFSELTKKMAKAKMEMDASNDEFTKNEYKRVFDSAYNELKQYATDIQRLIVKISYHISSNDTTSSTLQGLHGLNLNVDYLKKAKADGSLFKLQTPNVELKNYSSELKSLLTEYGFEIPDEDGQKEKQLVKKYH